MLLEILGLNHLPPQPALVPQDLLEEPPPAGVAPLLAALGTTHPEVQYEGTSRPIGPG